MFAVDAGYPEPLHCCPVQHFAPTVSKCGRLPTQPELPVAGLVPATHVFEGRCVDCREDVDDRDEPGQGDLELFLGRHKQPNSLNRTAMRERGGISSREPACPGAYRIA